MPIKVKLPEHTGESPPRRVGTDESASRCPSEGEYSVRSPEQSAVRPTPAAARKAPYLSKRGDGSYYFTRRFPQQYLDRGVFKQPSYRKSLGTKDRLVAERKARQLAARFDRVLECLEMRDERHGGPKHAKRSTGELNDDDVKVIAQRFETLLLHSDDIDRQERMEAQQLRDYVADVETQRNQLREANAHGNFEASADDVRGFLAAEQMTCEEGTDTWRALLKAMTHAQLKALRGILTRLDGDELVPTPELHPQVRREGDVDDLDAAFAFWLAHAKPRPKTVTEARSVFRRLKSFTGKTRISSLSRQDMVDFRADESLRLVGGRRIRPQTVNKLVGLVHAIFKLVVKDLLHGRGIESPLKDMSKERVKPSDVTEKQDLSQEQLTALFTGMVHARGARPVGGAGEAGFWLPVLGYTNGARMSELAQLSVHEVLVRDCVVCLWLTTRDNDEQAALHDLTAKQRDELYETSLKTGQSRRVIPVHPRVLELGFMDYVEHMRKLGSFALFPDIRPDQKGNISGNFSKWFNGYLGKVGIKRRGVDWISFRHTLKTAMRGARVEQEIRNYVQGHTSKHTSEDYGRFEPTTLLAALSTLSFPALARVPKWTPAHMRSHA